VRRRQLVRRHGSATTRRTRRHSGAFLASLARPLTHNPFSSASERAGASFPMQPLQILLAGGAEAHALRQRVTAAVRSDPLYRHVRPTHTVSTLASSSHRTLPPAMRTRSKAQKYNWERADLYRHTLEMYLAMPKKVMSLGEKDPLAAGRIVRELLDEPCGVDLHLGMFIPTIQGQGDAEQQAAWLPLCYSLAVIGTYAQTELGHGTYLRGLETTATCVRCVYAGCLSHVACCGCLAVGACVRSVGVSGLTRVTRAPACVCVCVCAGMTRQRRSSSSTAPRSPPPNGAPRMRCSDTPRTRSTHVLTSPHRWPGGLGKTANHVICMARLVTNGIERGPHAFVVPIRAADTHAPLPGIIVGDIGGKMGYNAVDNGFLRFDAFRVPRRAMLMKHARVEADGSYTPPPVAKAAYGTMVFVRADIVMNAALFLKKAVTIAVRYATVRRQSSAGRDGRELQVLDYAHSQRTLLPLVATAYAFHFTAEAMRRMYMSYEKESRTSGDFSALPELHATSSGLKALCSWRTKDGIEACRLACGALTHTPCAHASHPATSCHI
jgi:alkylation response protein AidB-like acyl-CoA dehydrogenase